LAGTVAHGEVGAAVVEARQREAGLEAQACLRVRGGELGQARDQPGAGERMQRRDADEVRVAAGRLQCAQDVVQIGQRTARRIRELAAGGGERDPARVALEQRQAQP
jgi:hypothetical protein